MIKPTDLLRCFDSVEAGNFTLKIHTTESKRKDYSRMKFFAKVRIKYKIIADNFTKVKELARRFGIDLIAIKSPNLPPPPPKGNKLFTDPSNDLFPPEHELGHALMTPKGQTMEEYFASLNNNEHRTSLYLDSLIARLCRNSMEYPYSSVRDYNESETSDQIKEDGKIHEVLKGNRQEAREIVDRFMSGKSKFDKDGKHI